jgi:sugar/nucleoside kinase (ribokinase family)
VVVVKQGIAGAVASESASGKRWNVAAANVDVVDTTGAGDAFIAGVLCAYLDGKNILACLENGVGSGARAVCVLGGRPALPTESRRLPRST